MRIRAYAKINLGLRVLRKRGDGYHEIQTLMQSISLADELLIEPYGHDQDQGLILDLDLEGEPPLPSPPEENLVYRAAELIFKATGQPLNLRIKLLKRIPVGAGLGGGSSDGAATLIGLNRLLELGLSEEQLASLAAPLGSDVPFFLKGGTCLISGRGERVVRLPALPKYHFVLLIPPFALSTAEVYREFDRLNEEKEVQPQPARHLEVAPLRNDLERAALALRPELARYRDFLEEARADFFGMSGSGPTWFAGFKERRKAVALAAEAARLPGRALLAETIGRSYEIC
ncbi:MAG: 4-(cytidine 5'-diphospho)-2-C-methyl-D-erythritol kinase [Candidatus Bipolaricaulia bacterium]